MQTLPSHNVADTPGQKKKAGSKNYSAFAFITEQSAIDAAFLWLQRSQVIKSGLHHSQDIKELDGRIEANLDGLSAVGELGWQVCVQQLDYEEAGEVFTAAVVALRSRNTERIKRVCDLALTTPEMTQGLISALGWVEADIAAFWIPRFLAVTDPNYRMLGLAACSVRRDDPGPYLAAILQDPQTENYPALHARALRLIGELKRWELLPALNAAMAAENATVKFWANWSAVLLGDQAALVNLKPWVLDGSGLSEKAVQMAFSALPLSEARSWINEMVSQPELTRRTISAIGVLGDPQAIPWLLQQMAEPQFMRIAGWAFSQITGIDLVASSLTINPPEDLQTGPTDDPADDNVAMDPDEELPWPDRQKITSLWQAQQSRWQPGQRYFQGRAVNPQVLAHSLASTNQRQQELAALQRAVFDKPAVLVAFKAPQHNA